jgi:undecaprenyl-diphosphatase
MLRRLSRVAALTGAAMAVGVAVAGGRGRELDEAAFRAVNRDHGPGADRFFSAVTELGSWWAALAAAAALSGSGRRREAGRALAAASVTWLAGQGLKRLFLRARPYDADPSGTRLLIGRPKATSWPSSHPAVLVSFLSVAGRELGLGGLPRAALGALTACVGTSRVHLGVHFPADVVGGILMGRAVAAGFPDERGPRR